MTHPGANVKARTAFRPRMSVRLYTKPAYQAYNRSYEYFAKTMMRYCAHKRINFRSDGDQAIKNICQALEDYNIRMQQAYLDITGVPCNWEPGNNPNRHQFDLKPTVVTKADQAWIKCIVTYDKCLIDLLERAENALIDGRKVSRFKHEWKRLMVATAHALLREHLAGFYASQPRAKNNVSELSTENVDKVMDK